MRKPAANGQQKPLDERRENERQKYVNLAGESPKYGATNHGRDAIELVAELKPGYVADLGCGRNEWVKILRERLPGVRADGVDFACDEADINAPMHKLPLADNCADVVTAFDSLEHLLPDEVDPVLDEIARILKPDGTFIVSICYSPSRIKVDGEGLHPTVQPEGWWMSKLARFGAVRREERYLPASEQRICSLDMFTDRWRFRIPPSGPQLCDSPCTAQSRNWINMGVKLCSGSK